jgi:hypothetical protein
LTTYFVSINRKDNVVYLATARTNSKKIKKLATTTFSECSDLIKKIKSNFFLGNKV